MNDRYQKMLVHELKPIWKFCYAGMGEPGGGPEEHADEPGRRLYQ